MNALSQFPDRSPDIWLPENPGYDRSSCDAGSSQGGKIGSVDSSDGDNRNGDGLADGGQSLTRHRDSICFGRTWKYSAGTEIIGPGFFCFQGLGNGFGGYAENLIRSQLGAHFAGGQVTLTDMDAVGATVYGDVEAVIDNQRNVIALGEFADGKRLPQKIFLRQIFFTELQHRDSGIQRLSHLFLQRAHAGAVWHCDRI